MFAVDEAAAEAIRKAFQDEGELAAIVELRQRFPLFESNEHASSCVRAFASWKPLPAKLTKAEDEARRRNR